MIISGKVGICLTMALASLIYADSSAISRPRSVLQDSSSSLNHQRSRRSNGNDEADDDEKKEAFSTDRLAGYRFSDDFFNYPVSGETAEATAEAGISRLIKDEKKVDGCERVFKDSMICMICNDPEKNSKYEQCSYVARPNDKIHSYTSSRSTGNKNPAVRENDGEDDEEKPETGNYGRYEKEDDEENDKATPYGRYNKEDDSEDEEERAYDYGKPQKYVQDGGGSVDSYGSRESAPSSLSYRSDGEEYHSGGGTRDEQPESTNERQGHGEDYRQDELNNYDDRHGRSSYESGSNDNGRSSDPEELPRNSQKSSRKRSQCREVQKDSMTCTICSDPENGGNFEKCSYKHQPNDKLYKFSKSKRFGYPVDRESSPEETKTVTKVVDHAKTKNPRCRKVRKDSTTLCSVCEDAKNGERSEQCEYNRKTDEPPSRRVSRTIQPTTRS